VDRFERIKGESPDVCRNTNRANSGQSVSEIVSSEQLPLHWNQSGVYLIGSSALGWFKIGQSQDIMGRLGCYRSYPFRIDMKQVWSVEDTRCREMEKVLHALVESKRIRANGGYSEWFNLDILDIHVIRETMKTFVCIS
jgi:hypothetical protein